MNKIEIYTWSWCPYCIAAKTLLKSKGQKYENYDATKPEIAREMQERSGGTSVPQIFINGEHIGGFDDMSELNSTGELDKLLAAGDGEDSGQAASA